LPISRWLKAICFRQLEELQQEGRVFRGMVLGWSFLFTILLAGEQFLNLFMLIGYLFFREGFKFNEFSGFGPKSEIELFSFAPIL
jgi:hypothetical protein